MSEFPSFMRNKANRIASVDSCTHRIEGNVFDSVDGAQMTFSTAVLDAVTAEQYTRSTNGWWCSKACAF